MSGKQFSINNSVPSRVLFLILAFGPISQKTIQTILHPKKKSGQIPKVLNQLEDEGFIERRKIKTKPVIKITKGLDKEQKLSFYFAQREPRETRILGCIPTFKNFSHIFDRELTEKEKIFISQKLSLVFQTPFYNNHFLDLPTVNLEQLLNSIFLEELSKQTILELNFKDKLPHI